MAQFIRTAKSTIAKNKVGQRDISGLRIVFQAQQSLTTDANPSEIKIFNLSNETIALLKEPDAEIFLECGYDGVTSTLTWGNDLEVDTVFEGPDKVTIVKSKDGGKQLAETTVNLKIAEGADLSKVVGDIASKFKDITFGSIEKSKLLGKGVFSTSGVLNGQARETLDELLKPLGISYSIQKGELKISSPSDVPKKVVSITPSSGLIGSPEKTKKGVKVKCLLNPAVVPNGFISLTSRDIFGLYKVTNLTHAGDTHGETWETEIEAETVKK